MSVPYVGQLTVFIPAVASAVTQTIIVGRAPYASTVSSVTYIPGGTAAPTSGQARTFTVYNRNNSTGAGTVSIAAKGITTAAGMTDNVAFDLTISATTASLIMTSGDVIEFESALTGTVVDPGGRLILTYART